MIHCGDTITTELPRVQLSLNEQRREFSVRPLSYCPSLGWVYHMLPSSRWNKVTKCWDCEATPSVAWMLVNSPLMRCEATGPAKAMADSFGESLRYVTGNDPGDHVSPPICKTEGWSHQLAGYGFANARESALLAMEMGCGKSWVAVNLVVNRGAKKVLILSPVSVMPVWRREFERHSAIPVRLAVCDKGGNPKKTAHASECIKLAEIGDVPGVVVVNYESAWRSDFAKWSLGQRWDMVICDESHRLKGHDTAVSKYAGEVGKRARYRLCLTGTPMPHSPLDLFGQFRFLDRGIFGTWFYHFRNRYAKTSDMFPSKVESWLNQEELQQRMKLLSYRVKASDVLDLPEAMHHERRFSLSPKAKKIYVELEDELISDVGGGVVTATNALTKLLRLQQLTGGWLRADDADEATCVDDGKIGLLTEILEDIGSEPVVVFCRFHQDIEAILGAARKMGKTVAEISGRSKSGLTDKAMMADVDVCVVQIQAGGAGIDLTRARYAVYYNVGFSLGDYEQSLARLHRPGQSRTVHYFHLLAESTIDEAVYGALRNRKDLVQGVLSVLTVGRT